jgi:iron complex outermembrane recepter protein
MMSSRATPLFAVGAVVLWATAAAQSPSAANQRNLSIPAEPLANALNDLAQQSGLQVMFASELVARLRSAEVKGTLTPEEALQRLLSNTGLHFEFVNPHTITIVGPGTKPSPDSKPASPDPKPPTERRDSESQATPKTASNIQQGDHAMPRRNLFARWLGLGAACSAALYGAGACAQDTTTTAAAEPTTLETITVSARKRDESLAKVPEAITVFTAQNLEDYNIQSFDDYATKTPNISFAYGGGPTGIADSRTIAIRGITGQNLFGTAGATGFYIDDTPVPGSVDPRVLDIDNIEVLKGPQGTLFGESSLGGNVRLITKRPDLSSNDIGYMVQAGATSGGGSADGGAGVIGNLVLSPDVLALRVVLFGNHDAGYLTRTFPTTPQVATTGDSFTTPYENVPRTSVGNQGAQTTYGGSISTLFKVTQDFEARLRVMYQNTEDHGFPATFAPLPAFQPDYTLNRAFNVQPDAIDRWALPSLDLKYSGPGFSVVSSTSYFYRHTHDLEDSTYGTEQGFYYDYGVATLPNQPLLWDGERYHNQFTEELRLSFEPIHNLSGTVGAFFSNTRSLFFIPNTYATGMPAASPGSYTCVAAPAVCPGGEWPNDLIWSQNNPGTQKDSSVFGELYYKFFDKFNLTLGARKYWLKQTTDYTANGYLDLGPTPSNPQENTESGTDPKVGLSYQATDTAMFYVSASKGFRAGGAQANFPACVLPGLPIEDITHIKSDTLWSYEGGTKVQVPETGLLLSAAGFHINWDNPQQQVALPCGFYLQLNGGSASINGGEIELTGKVTPAFQLRFGMGYEKTDIVNPGALSYAKVMPGIHIPGVPAWTASVGGVYTQALTSELDGFISADYSYTGNSISLLNGGSGLIGSRPPYSLANLRFGVQHAKQEVSLNIHNLGNAKPNLGDIGYVGYAQYEPNMTTPLTPLPQVATLQPLTVILQYKNNF